MLSSAFCLSLLSTLAKDCLCLIGFYFDLGLGYFGCETVTGCDESIELANYEIWGHKLVTWGNEIRSKRIIPRWHPPRLYSDATEPLRNLTWWAPGRPCPLCCGGFWCRSSWLVDNRTGCGTEDKLEKDTHSEILFSFDVVCMAAGGLQCGYCTSCGRRSFRWCVQIHRSRGSDTWSTNTRVNQQVTGQDTERALFCRFGLDPRSTSIWTSRQLRLDRSPALNALKHTLAL